VTVDLDGVERDLAAIDDLLAESGERGERLRDALRARADFAAGRVRRDGTATSSGVESDPDEPDADSHGRRSQ
jgi:hypothetical protein